VKAFRLEKRGRRAPEVRVVVDDENGRTHGAMVPRRVGRCIVASPILEDSPDLVASHRAVCSKSEVGSDVPVCRAAHPCIQIRRPRAA
jgi:hypothetical protein